MSDHPPATGALAALAALAPDRIEHTAALLAPYIRRTPVIEIDGADVGRPGIRVVFKLEFLQHGGSFKARGAFTNLLTRPVPTAGVVAASGGNHGVAVALAAKRVGHTATIFVPGVCSPAKLAQIRHHGAQVHIVGERYADALAASEQWQAAHGALPVHAFEQIETLLGQATVAHEFEQQAPGLDAVLVAVGGGGLIGGMAAWYRSRTRLIAVEPEGAPTLARALAAGQPVDAPTGSIAADSLAPRQVGALMFPLAQRHVERSVLVDDDAIRCAQRTLWQSLRVVAEPGGAAAFAALQSGAFAVTPGQRIGVLLCGANTDAVHFPT